MQLSFLNPAFPIDCQLLGSAFIFKGQLLGPFFLEPSNVARVYLYFFFIRSLAIEFQSYFLHFGMV